MWGPAGSEDKPKLPRANSFLGCAFESLGLFLKGFREVLGEVLGLDLGSAGEICIAFLQKTTYNKPMNKPVEKRDISYRFLFSIYS